MTFDAMRAALLSLVLVAAACGTGADATDALPGGAPPGSRAVPATIPPPPPSRPQPPTTTAASETPSTTTTAAPCEVTGRLDGGNEDPPVELTQAIDAALASDAWEGLRTSVSIWVNGYGEVTTRAPDLALLPASNQKLYTALGALLLLPEDGRFVTEVRQVDGDLVLVAGGDATLRTTGSHSLDELARQVRLQGVAAVDRVIVDVTHFEAATEASGWQIWHVPQWVGPMSALMVDGNRYRTDAAFVADPARANGERFVEQLRQHGIVVSGPVVVADSPSGGDVVASVRSAPVRELLATMLRRSDNEIAESLLREIGGGETAEGAARVDAALAEWCLDLAGTTGDGSGLSRANFRSAREWRRLLQLAAFDQRTAALVDALPRAGRSGTLSRRLRTPGVVGNVAAKTGSILGGRALSGYATTASGRLVVFSIVANGDPSDVAAALPAIDELVEAVVLHG